MKYLIGATIGILLFIGAADFYNIKNNYSVSNGFEDFFFKPTLGFAMPLNGNCIKDKREFFECNKFEVFISDSFYRGKQ